MSRRTAAVASLLVIAVSMTVAITGFFFFRDNFATHYPLKVISAGSFRGGEIPWWNFHDSGGQPLAGNPNALTFYPDNVLYLFLPAHVAFNLHFLIHWVAGWFAMRALCRARGVSVQSARFGATVYAASGVVVSLMAFYNLVTAVALIPLVFYGVERRSERIVGVAIGLMILAAEPVVLFSSAVGVIVLAAGRMRLKQLIVASAMAVAIGSPQILTFLEIAGEVERSVGFSAATTLRTSLPPMRISEFFFWPFSGFLNDPGGNRVRLFSTLFLGVIALPALVRRSRYTLIAVSMLAFAAGHYNPLMRWAVEASPALRIMRFPEKFALPLTVALAVLISMYFHRSRFPRIWVIVTIAPLIWFGVRALPIDSFHHYRVEPVHPRRVHVAPAGASDLPARLEYRQRARDLEPLFGATAGLSYGLVRSPDGMHSLLSRLVAERFALAGTETKARYLRLAGCDVPGGLPQVVAAERIIVAPGLPEAVAAIEASDVGHRTFVAPFSPGAYQEGGVTGLRLRRRGQRIEIELDPQPGRVLLMVNQTYFKAWVARARESELETLPLNIDRLGVVVPAGVDRVVLEFGRLRSLVVISWSASLLLLVLLPWLEKRESLAREIERTADEDRADV